MRSGKWIINCDKLCLGKPLRNFLITFNHFMALTSFSFIWWLKFNKPRSSKPRCFWALSSATEVSLKWIDWWAGFKMFLRKIIYWACWFRSVLNCIYLLYSHSDSFFKSLLKAVLEASVSWTIETSDMPSTKSLIGDTKLCARLLI